MGKSSNPLMAAVVRRDTVAVGRRLSKGATPQGVAEALVKAATLGEHRIVHQLSRADPRVDDPRCSPLHAAAANGCERAVEQLLDARPSLIDRVDASGDTPLAKAIEHGYYGVVRELLVRGAALDRGPVHALLLAARNGNEVEPYAAWLEEHGARRLRRTPSS